MLGVVACGSSCTGHSSHLKHSRATRGSASAADFDSEGNAWLAGLEGAVRIAPNGQVRRYREAEGVQGDLVSDVVKALNNRLFFVTAEGLGTWTGDHFNFAIDGSRSVPRATALAVDNTGNLWGAGPRGVWRYDGQHFTRVGSAEGLPAGEFTDIAVDAQNRVWFANTDGLVLFDQSIHRE